MMIFFEGDEGYLNDFERVYAETLKQLGLPDEFEVEAVLADGEYVRGLNRETRGADNVTDVLSFPAVEFAFPFQKDDYAEDRNPETGKIMLGEIAICEERMKEQAEEYGHSEKREACYLFLHGLLHLLGFDHIEDDDRETMRAREESVLDVLGIFRE